MIDHALTSTPQWVVVRLVPLPDGKTDKIPLNFITGQACNAHEHQNHTTYDAAAAMAQHWGHPTVPGGAGHTVGFVLTAADPWFCIDIDGARGPAGEWSALSQEIVAALPGCMVEISQSGKGLHVWGRHPSPPAHSMKRIDLHIEAYTELRFIAIGTGQVGQIAERCDALPAFLATYFPPKNTGPVNAHGDGPRPDWRGPTDDADLLRRMLRSSSAASVFGGKASFADLWDNNVEVLHRIYPGDGEGGVDRSSVDAALAQHLAFWTGCDADRMVSLMQQSGLSRQKWEDREDYLPRTVRSACGMQRDVLADKPVAGPFDQPAPARAGPPPPPGAPNAPALALPQPAAPAAPGSATMTVREGSTFLTPTQAAEVFQGCYYVADLHRVLVPGGRLYKPDQFKALYGGYAFAMDTRNERTSRNAFEAFTESQALKAPHADGTAFRPDLPYGHMITTEGRRRVNMFAPAQVRREKGDPSRFIRHLEILYPVQQDRDFLLYWMANAVQNPGHKSQWFCLLVGAEGNGKSLFSRCLAHAVGNRYTHWPDASKLGGTFNSWLYGKLLICIEDLQIGDSAEVWEKLKPMVTGESLEIEGKGIDQRTDEVCANFIANSNHKNAIRATLNDRRVCHLWCAQQNAGDVKLAGLDEDYMSSMYDWLKGDGGYGYAVVAEYLHTLVIPPEFGLNWFKGRAPRTSSTGLAVLASMGPVEQEILEAVARDDLGFKGGWVSSGYLDKLLERLKRNVAPNKRREILQGLGYDWHPALPDGRVNNPVLPDGGKVKLFIRNDSPARMLTTPAEAAAAYSRAQGGETPGARPG